MKEYHRTMHNIIGYFRDNNAEDDITIGGHNHNNDEDSFDQGVHCGIDIV